MLANSRLVADEYEKQYYGFSSTELTEDFKNHVIEVIKNVLTDMKIAISEEKDTPHDQESLETSIQQLYEAYLASAQSAFERFEAETRTIFAIPKNVILEEDKLRQNKYTDEDIDKLKCELVELENEYIQAKVFLAKCKQMKEQIEDSLEPVYEKVKILISKARRLPKQIDMPLEANQQKILEVHDTYVQHYFNKLTIGNAQDFSSIKKSYRSVDFQFD